MNHSVQRTHVGVGALVVITCCCVRQPTTEIA